MEDSSLFNQGILAGTIEPAPPPLFYPADDDLTYTNIDPALRDISDKSDLPSMMHPPPVSEVDETVDRVLAEEVAAFLHNTQGSLLAEALDEAHQRHQAQFAVVDDLQGLDEEELDKLILTDAEVRIKERVWVELNKDYLEAIAGGD